jgi:hypothetical protein
VYTAKAAGGKNVKMSDQLISNGSVFGEWTVLEFSYINNNRYYLCRCRCGVERCVRGSCLINGGSKMCRSCSTQASKTVHGEGNGAKRSPEYHSWRSMKDRCYLPTHEAYHRYGGRGVVVCDRWRNSFEEFLKDMGRRPSKMYTLDHIDNNGDYEPFNCRWATLIEQNSNKVNNHMITFNRETKTMSQWARDIGIRPGTLSERFRHGGSVEQALGVH